MSVCVGGWGGSPPAWVLELAVGAGVRVGAATRRGTGPKQGEEGPGRGTGHWLRLVK